MTHPSLGRILTRPKKPLRNRTLGRVKTLLYRAFTKFKLCDQLEFELAGGILIISYLRTVVLYTILIVVIRMMGKRQIGQMEPSEFVVTMLVANLASIPMQEEGLPLFTGLVPIVTVLAMELILSYLSMKSMAVRKLLCGKPVILIDNGTILMENLRRTRVTLDELTGHLRQKDVLDIQTVQYAILETNGNLSVFPYPSEQPATARDAGVKAAKQYLPITLISDGRLLADNLKKAKKDGAWLHKVLRERNATLDGTWLLTVDEAGHIYYIPKEERR